MGETKILDKIYVRDLTARCIIGIQDWERKKRQDVRINLTLYLDLSKPSSSDNIKDTVDYKKLKNKIIKMVEKSKFKLIERLAQAISELCLVDTRVERVDVTVDKPGALRFAKSAAVEITRLRDAE